MENLWRSATLQDPNPDDYKGIQFWANPERAGWLTKQGDYIKTWRRRWFVLKQGKLLWFKDPGSVTRDSIPRGVVSVDHCLTVKGAEDTVRKAFAFELSTRDSTMYFVADSEKDREDWINSIGRSIVQHSRSVTDSEVVDYDSKIRYAHDTCDLIRRMSYPIERITRNNYWIRDNKRHFIKYVNGLLQSSSNIDDKSMVSVFSV